MSDERQIINFALKTKFRTDDELNRIIKFFDLQDVIRRDTINTHTASIDPNRIEELRKTASISFAETNKKVYASTR